MQDSVILAQRYLYVEVLGMWEPAKMLDLLIRVSVGLLCSNIDPLQPDTTTFFSGT